MTINAVAQAFVVGQASNAGGQLLGGAQRAVSYAANILEPNNQWEPNDYIRLYQVGLLTPDDFSSHMQQMGWVAHPFERQSSQVLIPTTDNRLTVNLNLWSDEKNVSDRIVALSKNLPSPDEVLLLWNRELITEPSAHFLITMAFGGESDLAAKWMTLAQQIPGPSDLIAFAVKDSFTPDIVSRFEYSQELPIEILPWMKKQGLGGFSGATIPPGSTTTAGKDDRTKAQWFDHYWWSHWNLPSVGQGYEMQQRLYKESKFGPSPYANDKTYFEKPDLELLQKANDYPPFWRARLQAISYNPLGRIDVKRMYSVNILKEDDNNHEVFHAYKQQGYNDIDAERLTRYAILEARKNITRPTVAEIDNLYELGALTLDDAIAALVKLYYTPTEATLHMKQVDLKIKGMTFKDLITTYKRAYITGQQNINEIESALISMGMSEPARQRYITLWKNELLTTRKFISAEKAIKLFIKGLIIEPELVNRLRNLHYAEPDLTLLLNEAKHVILETQVKQLSAIAEQQSKEAIATIKESEKVTLANRKKQEKDAADKAKVDATKKAKELAPYTDKNIIAFHKANYLSIASIVTILRERGFNDATIVDWVNTYTPPDKPEDKKYVKDIQTSLAKRTTGPESKEATIQGATGESLPQQPEPGTRTATNT